MRTVAPIQEFAIQTVDRLLRSLVFAVHQAARAKHPDSIHDLRVSIRRFTQSLIAFEDFFPRGEVKRIRRRLKTLMRLSSEVRNRDIALEFLSSESPPSTGHDGLRARLEIERLAHEQEFVILLDQWRGREFSARWRSALALHER